jgi:hypothetical protein
VSPTRGRSRNGALAVWLDAGDVQRRHSGRDKGDVRPVQRLDQLLRVTDAIADLAQSKSIA